MSPTDSSGFNSPFIAEADDPIHGARFINSHEDVDFYSSAPSDLDNNSPDTLQTLDSSRRHTKHTFVPDNQFASFHHATSPNDGSFGESSSDSAESSGKGDRASPHPIDTNMDGLFGSGPDFDLFGGMMPNVDDGANASHAFLGGLPLDDHLPEMDFDFTNSHLSGSDSGYRQPFVGATTVVPSQVFNSHGAALPAPSPIASAPHDHQRQASVRHHSCR